MACNYAAIRRENKLRYGTDIGRIGDLLLANRYGDRTHFIYELLQNAEDALARRTAWQGSRAISFELDADALHVSHFGVPFDEADIRGICGIAESTKRLTEIGRFGIGFKSVFAFTERPEIHSGSEAFAIESFVWPVETAPLTRKQGETVIRIPLKDGDLAGKTDIADGLLRIGATSLLFLHEIREISWSVDGGPVGLYMREEEEDGRGVRRVNVVGQKPGEPEVDEEWLVFSRPVRTDGGELGGYVELAWLTGEDEGGRTTLRAVKPSPLAVFFPTVVETHLGFLMQGPYRTTPSRDNVPPRDEWNRMCVRETKALLVESLKWLRDRGRLDATALTCLPLDPAAFEEPMFRELFEATKEAFRREELLPTLGGTYVSATDARLARGAELRRLLSPTQLAALDGRSRPLHWLASSISRDRTPELRRYLVQELEIREFTPEALLMRMTSAFLEEQTDEWIQGLYEFLGARPALNPRVASLSIIRLEDGSHAPPAVGEVFLPGTVETSFPTVRADVCRTDEARAFLRSLGLAEPDPVDNVIQNILPKYREGTELSEAEYASDIGLMLRAFETDSRAQQDRLVKRLADTPWVRSVDGSGTRGLWAKPGELYFATESLRRLFDGMREVLLVDRDVSCLRGEEARRLLERSGAARYLNPTAVKCDLPKETLTEIRRREGMERVAGHTLDDKTIRGLDALLDRFAVLEPHDRLGRARDLWDALADLKKRRGSRPFEGVYTWWFFHQTKIASFDAAFVRMLNQRRWIPDASGNLRRPGSVAFEETTWEPDALLQSKIIFKPTLLDQLAREAGIEPGALDLLREMDVTSEAELRKLLRVNQPGQEPAGTKTREDSSKPQNETPTAISAVEPGDDQDTNDPETEEPAPDPPTPREFISYVAVTPEDEERADPDGLAQSKRMDLEGKAIKFIRSREPEWKLTEVNNPGFDLYQGATIEAATRWCEVKAMTGTLDHRSVGMSSTQFEYARKNGDAYWLYVVERAGTDAPNLIRIQDPAGKATTFTFDRGWRAVAG